MNFKNLTSEEAIIEAFRLARREYELSPSRRTAAALAEAFNPYYRLLPVDNAHQESLFSEPAAADPIIQQLIAGYTRLRGADGGAQASLSLEER